MRLTVPDPPLSNGKVALRRFGAGDAGWVTEACQDDELHRWLPLPRPYTERDARAYIRGNEREWGEGTRATFAIVDAATGKALGSIALSIHRPGLAEVGYWVRADRRRAGVATSAVRLLAGWAFRELRIDRLQLTTHPDNTASQRVAERAGFTREGVLRAYHPTSAGPRDAVMFSLLPAEL